MSTVYILFGQNKNDNLYHLVNTLELKIPPAVVVLIVAALMWLLARLAPELIVNIPRGTRHLMFVLLAMGGALFAVAGVWAFRRAQTTVNPTQPDASSSVVTSGVYRFSRNPMYVGMLLGLVGWSVYLTNALAVVGLVIFVTYMNRFQIVPEERVLSAKFGDEYQDYRHSVRRWL